MGSFIMGGVASGNPTSAGTWSAAGTRLPRQGGATCTPGATTDRCRRDLIPYVCRNSSQVGDRECRMRTRDMSMVGAEAPSKEP
jgi:hypothetical protein